MLNCNILMCCKGGPFRQVVVTRGGSSDPYLSEGVKEQLHRETRGKKKERQYIYTPSSSSSTLMLASSERTVISLTFCRAGRKPCDVVRTKTVLQSCAL